MSSTQYNIFPIHKTTLTSHLSMMELILLISHENWVNSQNAPSSHGCTPWYWRNHAWHGCHVLQSAHQVGTTACLVGWDRKFYISHSGLFGPSSLPGVFGRLADTLVAIYKPKGITSIKKWVDDFLFLQYLLEDSHLPQPHFIYDLQTIINVTDDLGWPWKASKIHPFTTSFSNLGFL